MKKVQRKIIVGVLALIVIIATGSPSYAYFDRGTVSVSLGSSSVSLQSGKSLSVSVGLSPASSRQLPGCGMPECPQSCGDGCLNEDGECTCGGTTYSTYYAKAAVVSSNTSVASADYSNGRVQIRGVGRGSARITVTASLRQYTSSSKTINVKVTAAAAAASKKTAGSQKKDSVSSVKKTKTAKKVDAAKKKTKKSKKVIKSKKGQIISETIIDEPMGRDIFKKIMGKKQYGLFEKKDSDNNTLYSWEFCGKDLQSTENINMNISMSEKTSSSSIKKASRGQDGLYLDFADDGSFPGKADIYMHTHDAFKSASVLCLYRYENGSMKLVSDKLPVVNGYTHKLLTRGGTYFLTADKIPAHPYMKTILIIIIAAAAAAVIIAARVSVLRKRRRQ